MPEETAETQEATEVEAQSQESESGEGRVYADKYNSVDALEAGAKEAQSHIQTLERENQEYRERISDAEERAQAEAQARTQTTGDEQKTARQNAEKEWKSGNYMESIEALIADKLSAVQKPLQERNAETVQELRTQQMKVVMKEFGADAKNFPKFDELHPEMGKLLEARRKRNSDYDSSFANAEEMISDLYFHAARSKPDLFKPDPSTLAGAGGGTGMGSRTRLSGPKPSKEADKRYTEARQVMGVESNPFQNRRSSADAVAREAEEEAAMARGEAVS